ncbi:MAG: calcineurin-like phosphoesterase family protein [Deltaproteobacteria bacterium]|nr:calcineurin-like phosphoesterase family protein [Deltaproteobacteria bacterium]
MLALRSGIALLVLIAALPAAAAEMEEPFASGVVFHDRNSNGARDAFDFGVRGVAVSNGRDVVQTDWRGRYRIAVGDDTILFVIKPGGWASPVDDNGLPRFYYIHKPDGSPTDLAFPGVSPTGPLPDQIDFPLYRQREPRSFRAILFADPQPRTLEELDLFNRDIIEEVIGTEAAFGMTLGDLVGDDLSLFEPLNQAIGQIGIPWHNVIGNHDMNYHAEADQHSDETFERVYGPPTYAFVYGKVHFIVLDDVVYEGRKDEKGTVGPFRAGISEDQLAFAENYLKTVPHDRLVVLAMHIPFESPPHSVAEKSALFEILKDRPHTVSMVGHTHHQESRFYGPEEGFDGPQPHHQLVHATASGSWWLGAADEVGIPHATMRCGAPNGYSILEFDGHHYSVRFKAARRLADHQMNIFAPGATSSESAAETEVLVNVFSGSERTQVEMRLGKTGGWIPLQREAREDPHYLAAIERDLLRNPRPRFFLPPALKSPHLWVGTLPANPPIGSHTIEVRATDMYGQVFHARHLIRVE